MEFRLRRATVVVWALGFAGCLTAADVLVSCEDRCVERWRVDARGAWTRAGMFIDGAAADVKPTGLTVRGETVYVGDSRGGIFAYASDGTRKGLVAQMPDRPDKLCVSPDGRWLYASTVLPNRIYRFACADGKGGVFPLEKIDGPRTLRFGPDGLLYVACRVPRMIRVYDVSGKTGTLHGSIPLIEGRGCFTFTGTCGEKMVVPGSRIDVIDLEAGTLLRTDRVMENAFASCTVDGVAYVADWTRGEVFRVDTQACTAARVATGVRNATAMVVLGDTGEEKRRTAFGRAKKTFRLKTPVRLCSENDFSRLTFNNTNVVTWLKAGFSGKPYVLDYDGDGVRDIVVYSGWEGQVWEGWWFFRNPTPKGVKNPDPVFEVPVRVPRPEGIDSVGECRYADGRPIGQIRKTPMGYEDRQLVDYDGDGLKDLIIASSEQEMPVWDASGFDAYGNWTQQQYHGGIYWCRRLPGAEPRYDIPQLVRMENGDPVTAMWWCRPMFSDWDGDGDLDVILQTYNEDFLYFENIGTRTAPVYTAGRFPRHADGTRMTGFLCHCTSKTVDWDGDGLLDILRCEEEGRVCWFRNTGKVKDRMPVFEKAVFFRQRAGDLGVSALATPYACDLDGDGDQDIVSGNVAGSIDVFENLSGPGVFPPSFAAPRLVETPDGKPLRIVAGPTGSIQGPIEKVYGYLTLSVADWDGDGLPDIMFNSVWGRVFWLKNLGPRAKPRFDFPRGVEVAWKDGRQPALAFGWQRPELTPNPRAILTMWRTTPVMIDWNRDGLMDLAMMDTDGDLAFYERARRTDGTLYLKHPRKAFLGPDGRPFLLAYNWDGGPATKWNGHVGWCGRRKFCFCDWNGDGLQDLVIDGGPNADVYEQIPGKGGDTWTFRWLESVGDVNISTHNPQPAACDFDGNGIPDMIVGAMDGHHYYMKNPRSRTPAKEAVQMR